VVLRNGDLCFAQGGKPPLDLKVFVSGNAFYNSALFYKQPEFTSFVFVLIVDVFQACREVDAAGGEPIMLYNTLGISLFRTSIRVTTNGSTTMAVTATAIRTSTIQSASTISSSSFQVRFTPMIKSAISGVRVSLFDRIVASAWRFTERAHSPGFLALFRGDLLSFIVTERQAEPNALQKARLQLTSIAAPKP
jgi:hypothetical protein